MKIELLRVNNLNCQDTKERKLRQITLCIMEGEILGFLGLSFSGKDYLVSLLLGESEETVRNLNIYISGKKAVSSSELKQFTYHITASNYIIGDWTVAEYICLKNSRWLLFSRQNKNLYEQAEACFAKIGLELNVTKRLKELSEYEKRIADIARAVFHHAQLLIIEDEFEGMRVEEIQYFSDILHMVIKKQHMAVIINSHSSQVMELISDKYIIFKRGKIVKKCRKDYIKNSEHLGEFLLGTSFTSRKKTLDAYTEEQKERKIQNDEVIYQVNGISLKNQKTGNFRFSKGQITTLLVLDDKEKERIFLTLSGRRKERDVRWCFSDQIYENANYQMFVKNKIVSAMHLGSREEVFHHLSTGENLLLPSLQKIPAIDYIRYSGSIMKAVDCDTDILPKSLEQEAAGLDTDDIIALVLERWYLFYPAVLILMEPFALCDMYGVSIVRSYLQKFASRGTSVVIIKSREEYIEDIADEIISLD